MHIWLNYSKAVLALGAAVVAIAAAPAAAADDQQGPPNPQTCSSSATATKCVKQGDAEINAAIPAPYAGVYGVYGPFWAG
jgi:hypothetical protein